MKIELVRQETHTDKGGRTHIVYIDQYGGYWFRCGMVYRWMGYSRREEMVQLIRRNSDEFEGKTAIVRTNVVEGGIEKRREVTFINFDGLITACLLAKTEPAKKLRSWAQNQPTLETLMMALEPHVQPEDTRQVYFIQIVPDGPIKIGIASNVNHRLSGISTSIPYEIKLLHTCGGGQKLEQKLHTRFSKHHIKGEWYNPDPEITRYIKKHIN